jgi:hypothetical protein
LPRIQKIFSKMSDEEYDKLSMEDIKRIEKKEKGAYIGPSLDSDVINQAIESLKERGLVNCVYVPGKGKVWERGSTIRK